MDASFECGRYLDGLHRQNGSPTTKKRPMAFPALYLLFLQQHQLCIELFKPDLWNLAASRTAMFPMSVQFIRVYYLLLTAYDSIRIGLLFPLYRLEYQGQCRITKLGGGSAGTRTAMSWLPARVLFPLTLHQPVFILIFIFKHNTLQGEEQRTEGHQRSFLHMNVVDR